MTGQEPHAAAPCALLAWIRENEPERYSAIGSVLACKDWLRFKLCGEIHTDRTEASTSFTDVRTQEYSHDALELYGLEAVAQALPASRRSTEIVGSVTAEAAAATGLPRGLPVACGVHDVTASAIGIGGMAENRLAIVIGTYSINETVSDRPVIDRSWFCRNAPDPGQWMNMSISPASTANLEWFLSQFCRSEVQEAEARKVSVFDLLAPELDAAFKRPSEIVFHPFLYGSPYGSAASAGFFGVKGWHDRADMLRAVLEGIVFNHRTHVDALKGAFKLGEARIAGGGARSETLSQMFADAIGLPVTISAAQEAGALGAALAAGVGAGVYADLADAMARTEQIARRHVPDTCNSEKLDRRFAEYNSLVDALTPFWKRRATAYD